MKKRGASKKTPSPPFPLRSLFLLYAGLLPWWVVRFTSLQLSPFGTAFLAGLSLLSAAFLLELSSEVLEELIPPRGVIVLVALLAVLPELAVDSYFAWQAGKNPIYRSMLISSMTGANRLLLGLGWPLLIFLFFWMHRKALGKEKQFSFHLSSEDRNSLFFLYAATIYSLLLPFKGTLSLLDGVLLLSLYSAYHLSTHQKEPSHSGPSERKLPLSPPLFRLLSLTLFASAGAGILLAAAPFAEGLIQVSKKLGVSQFVLVQWISPIASETPEILLATLFLLKSSEQKGFRLLLSAQILQLTLLLGLIPSLFTLSSHNLSVLPLTHRQSEELFLTSAQSLFGCWLAFGLELKLLEGLMLFLPFLLFTLSPSPHLRSLVGLLYLVAILAGPLWRKKEKE